MLGKSGYASADSLNKWVELELYNGHSLKFFLIHMNSTFFKGYISRSELNKVFIPLEASMEIKGCALLQVSQNIPAHCLNTWVCLNFQNQQSAPFFMEYIHPNFIGGRFLRQSIKKIDTSIVHCQMFFEEYDRRFHPMLLPENNQISLEEQEKRIEIVMRMEKALFHNLKKRAAAADAGVTLDAKELSLLTIQDISYLSDKQVEVYQEFFPHNQTVLDFDKLRICFQFFSNGEIQGNKYPGNLQPDSAAEFLFAEFAIQAIENQINPQIWGELLRIFVMSQEIFIIVYRPNALKKPVLKDYRFMNFRYYKQVNQKRKVQLRKKYQWLTLEQLKMEYVNNLKRAQSIIYPFFFSNQ